MKEFTEKQIEMLYKMSEIHFQWFQKYNTETNTKFEDVIKLNHRKMMDITESCFDCSDDMIDFIFEAIIKDYEEMLSDYDDTDLDDFDDDIFDDDGDLN